MSIGFIVDKRVNILLSSWVGEITDTSMIQSFKHMIETDPDWKPDLHHIADLTEADVSNVTPQALYDLHLLMKVNTIRGSGRVAIIAEQESDYRVSELYRSFFDIEDRDIEIFDDIKKAINWFKHGFRKE